MSELTTASFSTFGCPPVTITGDPPLVADLVRLWAPFVTDTPGVDQPIRVPDLPTGAAEVNRALVARAPYPAVHAGVVSVGSGAVAIPAVSGAGKSTLTAALCLAGAGYLSDEALVLDDSAPGPPLAVPYPKPIALSAWSATALGLATDEALPGDRLPDGTRELLFEPGRFGATSSPAPVAHLLLPARVDGPPSLEQVHRMQGLGELVRMSFNHYVDPRRFLLVAAAVANGAEVWRLAVGEPVATARLVVDTLAR